MTLEEKLRAYAAKGELVHLSLAFSNGEYVARHAAASPAGGYASGHDADPVEAIDKALKASPAKPARITAAVKMGEESIALREATNVSADVDTERKSLPADWTAP